MKIKKDGFLYRTAFCYEYWEKIPVKMNTGAFFLKFLKMFMFRTIAEPAMYVFAAIVLVIYVPLVTPKLFFTEFLAFLKKQCSRLTVEIQ